MDRFNLPEIYETAVRECFVPIDRIMLEITEGKLGKDFARSLDILTRLRLKGFGLATDDFGIGYSSMETLKHMPFTELKVDRIFAHGATADLTTRAILESSIKLGKALGLNVVVEGIEAKTGLPAGGSARMRRNPRFLLQNRCRAVSLPNGYLPMKRTNDGQF